jgi:hypothetical protein
MEEEKKVELQSRSTTIDVFVPNEQRQTVLNSIRRYRALCRNSYAILLLAQAAGATVEHDAEKEELSVKPDGERSKGILSLAMRKEGKALAYELRD